MRVKSGSFDRSIWCAVVTTVTTLGVATAAQAQVYWDGGAGASDPSWVNPVNWDVSGENYTPGQFDPAALNNGETISVTEPGLLVDSLTIGGRADTTTNLNNLGLGGTVNFNGGTLTTHAPGYPAVDIGVASTATSTWNHNSGTLNVGNFRAGLDLGATGTLNVAGGDINVGGNFYFGDNGHANVNITGGKITMLAPNRQFFVAFHPSATATMTMSGGTIDSMAGSVIVLGTEGNFDTQVGAQLAFTQTGGTILARGYVLGARTYSKATIDHSGGTTTADDVIVAEHGTAIYNLSGNATVTARSSVQVAQWVERAGIPSNGTVNQSGNSSLVTPSLVVGTRGTGNYNLSSGSLRVTGTPLDGRTLPYNEIGFRNLVIGFEGFGEGWDGNGTMVQTGGTVDIDYGVWLGSLDDSRGRLEIAGGTFNVDGSVNVGAALSSHEHRAVTDLNRQTSNVQGTFVVRGSAATITIGGNFLANPADKTVAKTANKGTLGFEINDASGTSLISVAGVADLDGAVIDMNLLGSSFVPEYSTTFNLLTAASFGATGTELTQNTGTGKGFALEAADEADWRLEVVAGGKGEMLRAVNLVVPGDTNADRRVGFDDLVSLAQNYNELTGQTRADGDFNRSGSVEFADLVILAQHYGQDFTSINLAAFSADFAADWARAQSLVPEPATLVAIAGASALVLRRRRTVR